MEFNYQALCKMIYHDFLKIVKDRGFTKDDFILLTGTDDTNGSSYYKGTKFTSIYKTQVMCNQLGITFSEVSPYYANLFMQIENTAKPEETQFSPEEIRSTLQETHPTSEEIHSIPEETRSTLEEIQSTRKETHSTPKENRSPHKETRSPLKETQLTPEETRLT